MHEKRRRVRRKHKLSVRAAETIAVNSKIQSKERPQQSRVSSPKISSFAYEMARSHFGKFYEVGNSFPKQKPRYKHRDVTLCKSVGVDLK